MLTFNGETKSFDPHANMASRKPTTLPVSTDGNIFRIPPYYYVHVLDGNSNVTRVRPFPCVVVSPVSPTTRARTRGAFPPLPHQYSSLLRCFMIHSRQPRGEEGSEIGLPVSFVVPLHAHTEPLHAKPFAD